MARRCQGLSPRPGRVSACGPLLESKPDLAVQGGNVGPAGNEGPGERGRFPPHGLDRPLGGRRGSERAFVEPGLDRHKIESPLGPRLMGRSAQGFPLRHALHRIGEVTVDLAEVLLHSGREHALLARERRSEEKRRVSEEDHAEAHRGPAAHGRLVPDRAVDRRRRREHDGEDRAEKQENDDRGVLGHEGHTIPFPFGQIYENYFIVQSMVRATPIFPRGPLAIDAGCGYTAGRRSASARRRPHSTMHPVNLPEHLILVFAAFCAGTVDAIAGGGGLIIVPALLAVGLPPHLALGTNKGQSLFGSLAAAIRYARAGLVDRDTGRITFPTAFLGALIGTTLVLVIRPEVLRPLVLVLLIVAAILVTIVRPNPRGEPRGSKGGAWWAAGLVALAVGTYDGFFGPGAGTFYIAGFVVFLR